MIPVADLIRSEMHRAWTVPASADARPATLRRRATGPSRVESAGGLAAACVAVGIVGYAALLALAA